MWLSALAVDPVKYTPPQLPGAFVTAVSVTSFPDAPLQTNAP